MSTSEGDRWLTVKDKEKNVHVTKVKLLMTIKVLKEQISRLN